MEFAEEKYKKIEFAGLNGKSFFAISSDLGMMPCQLQDLRMKDKRLDEALNNAEFYYRQYFIEQIEQKVINGINPTPLAREIYRYFKKLNAKRICKQH